MEQLVTDAQVKKLMDEYDKGAGVGVAALRAGMDRKTAGKDLAAGKLPSELQQPRHWRTRKDPFSEDWAELVARLEDAPELEAKAQFADLMARRPGRYQPGRLRSMQRRLCAWRAQHGPDKAGEATIARAGGSRSAGGPQLMRSGTGYAIPRHRHHGATMSFFKRMTNLGKGMWKVNMGPRDPNEEKRIKALQAELGRMEAETGLGSSTRPSTGHQARAAVPDASDAELLAAKLELLADQLREGRIDRETYDARCDELISGVEEEQQGPAAPVKRTL